jgi:glycine cleavage system transcriptional repressor
VPKTVVLTGVGRDRVGIVAELTDLLWQAGCNLMDSSMTLLRGEFALILMVELKEGLSLEALKQNLKTVESKLGLLISARELAADELQASEAKGASYIISVYGADRVGIVAGITRKLAELGANITDVETKSTGSPGEPLFLMILEVTTPETLSEPVLQSALNGISKQLNVNVTVQAMEVLEL